MANLSIALYGVKLNFGSVMAEVLHSFRVDGFGSLLTGHRPYHCLPPAALHVDSGSHRRLGPPMRIREIRGASIPLLHIVQEMIGTRIVHNRPGARNLPRQGILGFGFPR